MPFEDFPGEIQAQLKSSAEIASDEVPAIAFFSDGNNWVVLTNRRLIRSLDGTVTSLVAEEIKDLSTDHRYMLKIGGKGLIDRLDIETFQGEVLHLRLEPGSPLFGFWNAILVFTRLR